MYCLGYAERPQPDNQLSFMLHGLVFLAYHLQFASYLYSFASYSYSCKILQPYVVARVRMHSDAVFASICASRTKTFIKRMRGLCFSLTESSVYRCSRIFQFC